MLVIERPTIPIAYRAVKMPTSGTITTTINKKLVEVKFEKGDFLLVSALGNYRVVKPTNFYANFRQVKVTGAEDYDLQQDNIQQNEGTKKQ